MKIGIFSPYLDTMTGGEKYILTAATCLAKKHNVSIFWDDNEHKIIGEAERRFNLDLNGVKFTQNIFSKNFSFGSRLIESLKYDLIIYLSDGSIPSVLTKLMVHFQTPVEWVDTSSVKLKFKLKRINRFICNSKFTKSFIDEKFSVESLVLYPPVTVFSKGIDFKKEKIILNVGRFSTNDAGSSYKKQEFLIEAFKKMIKKGFSDWRLHLVISIFDENSEDLKKLKQQTEGFPIEIAVNPDNHKLWTEYSQAKVYWHAAGYGEDLLRFPDRAEHFGISTVEAMGAGAVPVVINAGGQPEIVEDSKNGFLWKTEYELLRKTIQLLNDEVLWNKLSTQAVVDVEKFSAENFCRSLCLMVI